MSSSIPVRISLLQVFSIVVFSLLCVSPVVAQQEIGFFSIVNAVGLPTNTMVSVDNRVMRKDGFKPGQSTGGLGLPAGSHTINVTNADCKPATLALPLSPGSSPILLIYSMGAGLQNGKPIRQIKLLIRANRSESTKGFSAIYLGQKPTISAVFNGKLQTIQAQREVNVGNAGERSLTISQDNQSLGNFRPEEAGNYLIVLYDTPDSKLGAVMIQDVIRHVAG